MLDSLKHSSASNISVILNFSEKQIHFHYADNGKGFDMEKQKLKKTLGLKSIESRIDFLGGECQLETQVGKGIVYSIFIPLV